jgi:hypothetical protein
MSNEYGYEFFMQECDKYGNILAGSTPKNLEVDFQGLRYSRAEGLDKIGKPKNIYTEKYSDSDRMRVHVPENITNEPTTVKFTFYFVGDNRQRTYHAFLEYIRKGYHRYYDTCRRKYLYFFVDSELKPAEEMLYGSAPYLKFDFTAQNIFGKTFDIE